MHGLLSVPGLSSVSCSTVLRIHRGKGHELRLVLGQRRKGMCGECKAHCYTDYLPRSEVNHPDSSAMQQPHTRSRTQKDVEITKSLNWHKLRVEGAQDNLIEKNGIW
jgi:hypothetical protein